MNANCFAATLTNGYGLPVGRDMLDVLGLDLEDDRVDHMPTPASINAGSRICRSLGRAANGNLRRAG